MSVGLITPPKKLLQLRWLALLASFARTHTVDDSVQYIEHGENIEDERNTSCCWYKFSELKSRNPRILFNTTEARKPGDTPGARTSRGLPKERDTKSEHISPACNFSFVECRRKYSLSSILTEAGNEQFRPHLNDDRSRCSWVSTHHVVLDFTCVLTHHVVLETSSVQSVLDVCTAADC